MKTFERASDGQLVVTLLAGEAAILKMILTEIRKLIAEPEADNAATQRLFPRAYLDPTAEESERASGGGAAVEPATIHEPTGPFSTASGAIPAVWAIRPIASAAQRLP